jgi:phage gp29-like protein
MRSDGIWLNDREFIKFDEGKRGESLSQELAVRSRSVDFFAIGNMYLPNPDPVLKSQGRDIQVYTDLLIDDRVGSGLINRTAASKSMVSKIERGRATTRQFKAVQEAFDGLRMNRIIEHILQARAYGYAPIEIIWDLRNGVTMPVDLVLKPQHWFVFGQNNDLRFLSRATLMTGEELPPRKFVCPRNEATYINPFGIALLSRCFWPVQFKKGGWRFWIQFSEKFGQLWPIGKLPRTATKEQIEDLLDILERMIQDGVGVIPDDGSIEMKESATKGSTGDLFGGIIDKANSAISTVWLGHSGAAESTPGKLGGENAAVDVRDDLRDDDANMIMETMQQVIDWMCEINWGSAVDSPRYTLKEKEQIDTTQAERDDKLTTAMEKSGLKLSSGYYQKTYNLAPEDIEEKQEPEPPPSNLPPLGGGLNPLPKRGRAGEGVSFAEPESNDSDNADHLAVRLEEEARPHLEAWLAAARKSVDAAGNLIDLRQEIIDANMELAPLAGTIRDALLISRLLGMAEVKEEIAASEAGATFAEFSQICFAETDIASALRLPFAEAITFFRNKVSIPTEKWNDLWLGMHSQGFMIAGAVKGDLLTDLRNAVDETISQGMTLADFRKQWDAIVERHGWTYVGGRNWRTRIVYETNTRQAYNAGRWQQVTDPDVLRTRPYLLYKHGDSVRPRVLHLSWDGTVLPADDPWWATHSPQNGWGCKCKVFSAGERDIARLGDKAKRVAPNDGSYTWTDKQGRSFVIPNGIDAGFQYNPGSAASSSKKILDDRISQLQPDIAARIRTEIAKA